MRNRRKTAISPFSHLYDIENKLFPDVMSQHSFGAILIVNTLKKYLSLYRSNELEKQGTHVCCSRGQ